MLLSILKDEIKLQYHIDIFHIFNDVSLIIIKGSRFAIFPKATSRFRCCGTYW